MAGDGDCLKFIGNLSHPGSCFEIACGPFNNSFPPNATLGRNIALHNFVLALTTYVTPLFVGVGLVTNTMSLLVFAGTYLKRQSMSVYLAALACADSVFLVSLLMHWLTYVNVDIITVSGICELVIYSSFCSCFLSIWFLVSCSVERYIAICHPLRKPEMCTTRRACSVVVGLVVLCCIAYSITLWKAGVSVTCKGHRVCEPVKGGSRAWHMAQICTDVAATLVLPFLVIVLLNTCILKSMATFYRGQHQSLTVIESYSSTSSTAVLLMTSSQLMGNGTNTAAHVPTKSPIAASLSNIHQPPAVWTRQTSSTPNHGRTSVTVRPPSASLVPAVLSKSPAGGGRHASTAATGSGNGAHGAKASRTLSSSLYTRAQMKLTKMLLLLSSLFLLFNLPDYVMRFLMLLQTAHNESGSHTQWMLAEIFHFAHNITFATKFLLFYICSTKFREAFRRFWWQASYKVVHCCRALVRGRSDTEESSDQDNGAIIALSLQQQNRRRINREDVAKK